MDNDNTPQATSESSAGFLAHLPQGFLGQVMALFGSVIFVHLIYLVYIRPTAEAQIAAAGSQGVPRTLPIILKDTEQEICLVLMCWAFFLIGQKIYRVIQQRYILDADMLELSSEQAPTREEVKQKALALNALGDGINDTVVVKTLVAVMRRYSTTMDIQAAAETCNMAAESEAARLESGLAMIRYIIWAIPSIGFIGTVRGIGQALSQAHLALEGDIAAMTDSLGVAFNSTLVALLVSIVLMLLIYQLQEMQDSLVIETQSWCEKTFLDKLNR